MSKKVNVTGYWNQFWFSQEKTSTLGVFRICLGLFLLVEFLVSSPNWLRFYGPFGLITAKTFTTAPFPYHLSLFGISQTEIFASAILISAITLSILLVLGFKTRLATICLFIIYFSLIQRNWIIHSGHDQVALIFLFLSIFAPLGNSYSLDKFLGTKTVEEKKPRWALRLMQITICLMYFFSTIEKLHGSQEWIGGMALYYISFSRFWWRFRDLNIFHNLFFSYFATYFTLISELSFISLVWLSKTRAIVLTLIALMHISIIIFMSPGVTFFSLIMLTSLVLFIPNHTIEKTMAFVSSHSRYG